MVTPVFGVTMAQDSAAVTLPRWLVERAIQCIASAEVAGAFKDCAAPMVGRRTLAALSAHLNLTKAAPCFPTLPPSR